MFTIYRQDLHIIFFCHRHNEMSCGNECLLVRQRNIFAGLDRRNRRAQTQHADNRCYKYLAVRICCDLDQSFHAKMHFCTQICDPRAQIIRILFLPYCHISRQKFADLLFKQINIMSCRHRCHLQISLCADDLQSLCSDRTGRTENSYLFHCRIPLSFSIIA